MERFLGERLKQEWGGWNWQICRFSFAVSS